MRKHNVRLQPSIGMECSIWKKKSTKRLERKKKRCVVCLKDSKDDAQSVVGILSMEQSKKIFEQKERI